MKVNIINHIEALETWIFRKLLKIPSRTHVTNEEKNIAYKGDA